MLFRSYKVEIATTEDLDKKVASDTQLNRLSVLFQNTGEYYWKLSAERKKERIEGTTQKFALVQTEHSEAKQREVGSASVISSSPNTEKAQTKDTKNLKGNTGNKKEKSAFEILFGN